MAEKKVKIKLVFFLCLFCGLDLFCGIEKDDMTSKKYVFKGRIASIESSITNEDVSSEYSYGRTLLHYACKTPYVNLRDIKILIKKGADPNILDDFRESPLLYALKNKNIDKNTLDFLIASSQKVVNVQSFKGDTPLTIACRYHSLEVIKQLLQAGAHKTVHIANFMRRTPLCLAAIYQDYRAVFYLLKYGAESINKRDIFGKTPIYYIFRRRSEEDKKIKGTYLLIKMFLIMLELDNRYKDLAILFMQKAIKRITTQKEAKELNQKIVSLENKLRKYEKKPYDSGVRSSFMGGYNFFTWEYYLSIRFVESTIFKELVLQYDLEVLRDSIKTLFPFRVQRFLEKFTKESRQSLRFEFIRSYKKGNFNLEKQIKEIMVREEDKREKEIQELRRIEAKVDSVELGISYTELDDLQSAEKRIQIKDDEFRVSFFSMRDFLLRKRLEREAKITKKLEELTKK